jgi:hypothetical protein
MLTLWQSYALSDIGSRRYSKMRVPAAYATDRPGHLRNCLLEALRRAHRLASPVVEGRGHFSAQYPVFFLPQINWEDAISSSKEQSRRDLRTLASRWERQSVKRDHQLIRSYRTEHLNPNKTFLQEDGMTSVDCKGIDRLQPRQSTTASIAVSPTNGMVIPNHLSPLISKETSHRIGFSFGSSSPKPVS